MPSLVIVKLRKITYRGESIGNDLNFTIRAEDRFTSFNSSISIGKSRNYKYTLFQKNLTAESYNLPIEIGITERDPVVDDKGKGTNKVTLSLDTYSHQNHSFDIEVKELGSVFGNKAIFNFEIESIVITPSTRFIGDVRPNGWVNVKFENGTIHECHIN